MKSVVITGASTGIGWGATKVLLKNGIRVFGSVRKREDAERLSTEFGDGFIPLVFDVRDESAISSAAKQVREHLNGETLFGLVNNAGIGLFGPLMHQPIEEYRLQIEVNLVGPLIVTQAFLPMLGIDRSLKGNPGRIINISSIAGKMAAPFLGAYAASKHGLEGFSESLRRELMLYGIDVIIIGPGAVATPIWDKAETIGLSRYNNTEYAEALEKFSEYMIPRGREGYSPEHLGEVIWQALTSPKPHVRYAAVPQRLSNWSIPMTLPRRVVDRRIAKRFGLERKQNSSQIQHNPH